VGLPGQSALDAEVEQLKGALGALAGGDVAVEVMKGVSKRCSVYMYALSPRLVGSLCPLRPLGRVENVKGRECGLAGLQAWWWQGRDGRERPHGGSRGNQTEMTISPDHVRGCFGQQRRAIMAPVPFWPVRRSGWPTALAGPE
jgi:hypothetical protein